MAFTYDLAVLPDVSRVRLLISDVNPLDYLFEDAEIETFLDLDGGNVVLAAARSLEVIAANEVMVQKRIKILDLSTDGPAEAKALLEVAQRFRDTWESAVADSEEADFEIVSLAVNEFTARQIAWNELVSG